MPGIGGGNPIPTKCGGGPSRYQRVWKTLRQAVGQGNRANSALEGENPTLEDEWRRAKARGLASVESFDERAAMQAFPDLATDHIPVFEEILDIVPPVGQCDEARRQAIVQQWVLQIESAAPSLEGQLSEIDDRLSLLNTPRSAVRTTQSGRVFQPFEPTLTNTAFNIGRKHTNYPAFSDSFTVVVLFDIGSAIVPSPTNERVLAKVVELLNIVLPSWVDFRIITGVGFILDRDLLDLTAFGS